MSPAIVLGICLALMGCGKRDAAPATATAGRAEAAAVVGQPAPASAKLDGAPQRRQLLEIKAELEVDLTKAEAMGSTLERLERTARDKGGFVANLAVGQDGVARMTLRVPAADLPAVRGVLQDAGKVTREQQTATDVTEAIADLDARLRVARAEETRILKLLEERTGSMADVLTAEKSLADVRERIERLEATQRGAVQRVDLATVEIVVRSPAAVVKEPTLAGKLAQSAGTGVEVAGSVVVALVQAALVAGPTLLMFALMGGAIAALARRLVRKRVTVAA